MNVIYIFVCGLLMAGTRANIDKNDCEDHSGEFGQLLQCSAGFVAIELCGSGRQADCSGYSHQLKCCKDLTQVTRTEKEKVCEIVSGGWGANLVCDGTKTLGAICGSGHREDCNGYSHSGSCCDESNLGRGDGSACGWQWGTYGTTVTCQDGTVGAGYCNGGAGLECNNGQASHGILCCSY